MAFITDNSRYGQSKLMNVVNRGKPAVSRRYGASTSSVTQATRIKLDNHKRRVPTRFDSKRSIDWSRLQ